MANPMILTVKHVGDRGAPLFFLAIIEDDNNGFSFFVNCLIFNVFKLYCSSYCSSSIGLFCCDYLYYFFPQSQLSPSDLVSLRAWTHLAWLMTNWLSACIWKLTVMAMMNSFSQAVCLFLVNYKSTITIGNCFDICMILLWYCTVSVFFLPATQYSSLVYYVTLAGMSSFP
jgi:hypothetical protein